MHLYDLGVSSVENYFRYCNKLRREAETLATYVTPSSINMNKRMASDQVIEEQIGRVKHAASAVEMMEKGLGIKDGPSE